MQLIRKPMQIYKFSQAIITNVRLQSTYEEEDEQKMLAQKLKDFHSSKGISAAVLSHLPAEKLRWWDLLNGNLFKQAWRLFKVRKTITLLYDQRFLDQRVNILGYDLAAAHFVVFRGGKVRFRGSDGIIQADEDGEYDLPKTFDPTYFLEEIDMSGRPILYDGLSNFDHISQLKVLKLSKCVMIDDWCLNRITDQFGDQLTHLDISHCKQITDKGLENIGNLKKLKYLNLSGLEHVDNFLLICILLQDSFPGLIIKAENLNLPLLEDGTKPKNFLESGINEQKLFSSSESQLRITEHKLLTKGKQISATE